MMKGGSEKPPKHKWKSLEGQTVESSLNFPPFKDIVVEDNKIQVIAVPLLLSDEATQLTSVDRKVHSLA